MAELAPRDAHQAKRLGEGNVSLPRGGAEDARIIPFLRDRIPPPLVVMALAGSWAPGPGSGAIHHPI